MPVTVSIAVNGSVVRTIANIPWSSGMNAQHALEQAYVTGTGYSFLLQYFGVPLGYEVMSFDGIAAQQGTDSGFYWEFIYNGNPARQGIDSTILNDGDTLLFTYLAYSEAAHSRKRVGAIRSALKARQRAS
ncbi:MAG TPA: DUF4430 domain-containing protein [Bradyrhizobium sp.]|jgi:hypothetical protein